VDDNRWIVESWPRALEEAYYRDPKMRERELAYTRKAKLLPGTEEYREEGMESTVAHFGHWLDSIRTRKPYWQDASAGHHAAACAHMVNFSALEKRLVEWDFTRDDIKKS